MTEKAPRAKAVTRAEFDALAERVQAIEKTSLETHDRVTDMHAALMLPTPGQEKSLLARMATVTINIESGGRSAALIIKLAAFLAAIGAIWAVLIAGRTP